MTDWPRAPLLLVASSSRTGPAEGQIALARFLRAQRIDARLGVDTVKPGDIREHLDAASVPWVRELRLSRHVRVGEILHDASVLARWVREGTPDLLHAAFAHDHHLALWAASRAGPRREQLRVVRTAHRALDVEPGPLGLRRRALLRTDGVIVHAQAYRQRLLAQGLDPRRVLAVPGSVDCERFSPGRAPRLREVWGVGLATPLVGIVARMKRDRGHAVLLQAFASLAPQFPEARLVLVGRGEEEPALRRLADSLAPGRVLFGGYQAGPQLVEAYRALDVAVWLREGNDGACRGVLEAMACGLPVVAGQGGAPGELVRDGAWGRVVDPSDAGAIAAALRDLLAAPDLRRAYGAAARLEAERHTLDRAGNAILAFYRALRALPPAGSPQARHP